ncbi:MAG TPA: hypothetical protein VLZ83_14525 [Edaphocola sp.]|nr:hypothetical protein [Edaphocola sp.]
MGNPVKIVKEYIGRYSKLKFQELRLEALGKTVKATGYLIYLILILLLFIGFIVFGFIALAEWLTELLHSRPLAYLCLSGLFLVKIIFLMLNKKWFVKLFSEKSLQILTEPDDDD